MHDHAIEIEQVSRLLGISTATIRRWERHGVLPFKPKRDAVGRRVFSDGEVAQMKELLRQRHPRGTWATGSEQRAE